MAVSPTPTIKFPSTPITATNKRTLTPWPRFKWNYSTPDVEYFTLTVERFPGDLPYSPVAEYTITDGDARSFQPTDALAECMHAVNPDRPYPYLVWHIHAKVTDMDLSEPSEMGSFYIDDETTLAQEKLAQAGRTDGVSRVLRRTVNIKRPATRED